MSPRVRLLPPLLAAVVLAGCADPTARRVPPTAATKVSTPSAEIDPVDLARVELNVKTRTVKLYAVDGGRWMVLLPGKAQERIEGLEYRVPDGVPLDAVEVYYVIPGVRSSNAVPRSAIRPFYPTGGVASGARLRPANGALLDASALPVEQLAVLAQGRTCGPDEFSEFYASTIFSPTSTSCCLR